MNIQDLIHQAALSKIAALQEHIDRESDALVNAYLQKIAEGSTETVTEANDGLKKEDLAGTPTESASTTTVAPPAAAGTDDVESKIENEIKKQAALAVQNEIEYREALQKQAAMKAAADADFERRVLERAAQNRLQKQAFLLRKESALKPEPLLVGAGTGGLAGLLSGALAGGGLKGSALAALAGATAGGLGSAGHQLIRPGDSGSANLAAAGGLGAMGGLMAGPVFSEFVNGYGQKAGEFKGALAALDNGRLSAKEKLLAKKEVARLAGELLKSKDAVMQVDPEAVSLAETHLKGMPKQASLKKSAELHPQLGEITSGGMAQHATGQNAIDLIKAYLYRNGQKPPVNKD